nr:hypothetical protein [Tanacetum cinerariifolium]
MQMESYESFMCQCEGGDVVLRQSHKPYSFGKLYYACPRSKPSQKNHGCGYIKWKDEITFGNTSSFSGPKTPSNSSSRASSSSGSSRAALSPGNTECPNCKLLTMNIKILEARLAMEKNPDDHQIAELRESAQSNNWEDVLVLYCWRANEEDLKRDEERVRQLQALVRETEERAEEKMEFIEKLKGNRPFHEVMLIDKNWTRLTLNRNSVEFKLGLNAFYERCKAHINDRGLCCCLCRTCGNREKLTPINIKHHIYNNGFSRGYPTWVYHGEPGIIALPVVDDTNDMINVLNDIRRENNCIVDDTNDLTKLPRSSTQRSKSYAASRHEETTCVFLDLIEHYKKSHQKSEKWVKEVYETRYVISLAILCDRRILLFLVLSFDFDSLALEAKATPVEEST